MNGRQEEVLDSRVLPPASQLICEILHGRRNDEEQTAL